jgi:pimeloyl-ACP methyl ester carboxylesterase
MSAAVEAVDHMKVRGMKLEVVRRGAGRPVLLLHGMQPFEPHARFLELLADQADIIAPSHPGFGRSPRPDGFETIYDLTRLYLDVLEAMLPDRVTLIGVSFGGWLAAEIAATCCHRIERLILVDPLGIKISERASADILDVFNIAPDETQRRRWHDPARWSPDYDSMTDAELVARARNWDALSLYGWHPYMHNPRLAHWLRRIDVPTLVLWGASDGIVTPDYGRAYAGLIPGARFALIEQAGHHPEIEQPEVFASHVLDFLNG